MDTIATCNDCKTKPRVNGLCARHYQRQWAAMRRALGKCSRCDVSAFRGGRCKKHYIYVIEKNRGYCSKDMQPVTRRMMIVHRVAVLKSRAIRREMVRHLQDKWSLAYVRDLIAYDRECWDGILLMDRITEYPICNIDDPESDWRNKSVLRGANYRGTKPYLNV